MPVDRRRVLAQAAALTAVAGAAPLAAHGPGSRTPVLVASDFGVFPNTGADVTDALQQAVDSATRSLTALYLPAGRYTIRQLALPSGAHLTGAGAASQIEVMAGGAGVTCRGETITLSHLQVRGGGQQSGGRALITGRDVALVRFDNLYLSDHARDGIMLTRCGGHVEECFLQDLGRTGIRALDSKGLALRNNRLTAIGNNGIQVWRSSEGDDGTLVTGNRIEHVRSNDGGDGQNGNGINVFRAGGVIVSDNHIADCAFSAVRGNAASDFQVRGNTCRRLGEVAIYAEFGFQGAVIANNIIHEAAMGISVTNFSEGGRLAVVQGNLVRSLHRRRHPEDIRGTGIGVEADTVVQGNTIEDAPTLGIKIGWGRFVRNVVASGNVIRKVRVGIGVSGDRDGGPVSLQGNLVADAALGAVRLMDHNAVLDRPLVSKANLTVDGQVSV